MEKSLAKGENRSRKNFGKWTSIGRKTIISTPKKCSYKININDHDLICYDGNEDFYATYSRRIDSVDDIKEKIKKKNIKAIGNDKYNVKTFKLNEDFAKMLIELY